MAERLSECGSEGHTVAAVAREKAATPKYRVRCKAGAASAPPQAPKERLKNRCMGGKKA